MRAEIHMKLRAFKDLADLAEKVRRWEDIGATGIVVSDHLFTTRAPTTPGTFEAQRHEPYTVLAAIGVMSKHLKLTVLVSNVSLTHPLLVARQGAELAFLFGGERVCLGIGAGWNAAEFASLGTHMPPHPERMDRLRESAAAMRALFRDGTATIDGEHIRLDRAPLNPRPPTPPRLAVGGGSHVSARTAASHADHFDLDAPTSRVPLVPSEDSDALRVLDIERRLVSTVDDVLDLRDQVDELSVDRDHALDPLTTSINVSAVGLFEGAAETVAESLHRRYQLAFDVRRLASMLGSSPYFVTGPPAEAAEALAGNIETLRLSAIVLPDEPGVEPLIANLHDR